MDFCGNTSKTTDSPQYFDPLGPQFWNKRTGQKFKAGESMSDRVMTSGPTGGTDQRDRIFNQLGEQDPGLQANAQNLTGRMRSVAGDSGWGAAADEARKNLSGQYLAGGPAFNAAMGEYKAGTDKAASGIRSRAMADAGDSAANAASQYSRVGQSLGTAGQQAAQAGRAAAGARASETIGALQNQANQFVGAQKAANYQTERGRQTGAGAQLDQALGSPLNYLSQIPSAQLAPAQSEAALTQGLAGNGFAQTPQSMLVKNPGVYDYLLSTIGSVTGAGGVQGGGGGGGF